MTDGELLELAAKAGGIKALRDPDGVWRDCTGNHPAMNIFGAPAWNPLNDDGDALRLAVKLHINIEHLRTLKTMQFNEVVASPYGRGDCLSAELTETDPYAATRHAIVRAAAEIGKETT